MPLKPILPARTPYSGKILERDMRESIKQLLAACGFFIYDLEQGYRKEPGGTRQSRGLPDLIALRDGIPAWAIQVKGWIPRKTMPGKWAHNHTPEQVDFGARWIASGGYYTVGTLHDVEDDLVDIGLAVWPSQTVSRSNYLGR
jgi:hypothetical protein